MASSDSAWQTTLSPIKLGGVTLKNRIVFAPTTMGLSLEEEEAKLKAIAAGGCAMIVLGDVPVGRCGRSSLYTKKGFARYQRLCHTVHAQGCLICAQLHQSDSNLGAMIKYIPGILTKKITPEELRPLLNAQTEALISKLPTGKVSRIAASFGPAAQLAVAAGFDMIQIHGDRMCGSFSSSLLNHRTDRYGGGPSARAQFAVEAVSAVRRTLPQIPIDYKLALRQENPHYGNAGVLLEEVSVFVPLLEKAGVTSFHVALANHSDLSDTIPPKNHPYFSDEGCFLSYCDLVRRYTELPLCGSGGLSSPDFVESQLASGRIDCAAMSRQLIADEAWPKKLEEGRPEAIRRCIRCNKACLGGLQRHKGISCIFNSQPLGGSK